MRNQTTLFIVVCTICFLFYRCNSASNSSTPNDSSSQTTTSMYGGYASEIDWGKHLVTVCGCGDCHTPKKMTPQGPEDDSSLLLSGHPSQMPGAVLMPEQLAKGLAGTNDLTSWNGPWGTSFTANLTPDSTGIGSWNEQQFVKCIRQSLFKGLDSSRPLMPPMPVESYKNLTDNELSAIFAFLKSIKPIHNIVPDYQPPAGLSK